MLELYRIIQGDTNRATITSNSTDVVFGGVTYVATPVKRSRILSRPNLLQNNVSLQFSVHTQLGLDLLVPVNKNLIHRLVIYRGMDVATLEQVWGGSLIQQGCSGESINLVYGGGGVSIRQLGDRRPFQRRCPFVLYDALTCRATPQTSSGMVTAVNTTNDIFLVSGLSSFEVGYFTGGVLCPSSVYSADNVRNRFISSHNKGGGADQIRISVPVELSVGDEISVLAGCDRTWQTCYSKFNNIVNFGGFPFLPLEDPYVAEVCSDDGVRAPDPTITTPTPEPNGNGNGNGDGNGGVSGANLEDGGAAAVPMSGIYRILIYFDRGQGMSGNIGFPSGDVSKIRMVVRLINSFWDRVRQGCSLGGGSALIRAVQFSCTNIFPSGTAISATYGTNGEDSPTLGTQLGNQIRDGHLNPAIQTEQNYYTLGRDPSGVFRDYRWRYVPLNPIGGIFGYDLEGNLTVNEQSHQSGITHDNRSTAPYLWGQPNPSATTRNIGVYVSSGDDHIPALAATDKEIMIIICGTEIATEAVGDAGMRRTVFQGELSPTPGDIAAYEAAKMSPIIRNTTPYMSPYNIKTYGMSINSSTIASKLTSYVNSGTGVPVIQSSYTEDAQDPGLLYKQVFIDGGGLT